MGNKFRRSKDTLEKARQTVEKLSKFESHRELDDKNFQDQVWKMIVLLEEMRDEDEKNAYRQLVSLGGPNAFCNLMKKRRAGIFQLREKSLISEAYNFLALRLMNGSMWCPDVARTVLDVGIVEEILNELKSPELMKEQENLRDEIIDLIGTIWNISLHENLFSELGEKLRENDFFGCLLPYIESKYCY